MSTEPVLITAFNRPDLMRRVLERVRTYEPNRVFIAVDGPRAGTPSDRALVNECQNMIEEVDWNCEVETLIHDENLGCGRAMSTAITWFFEHNEQGIILEDDTLPDSSFFLFCAELLNRYVNDERVFAVSGCNLAPDDHVIDSAAPYRFSRIPTVWGWATWRRAWQTYRLDIRDWRSECGVAQLARTLGRSVTMTAFWATEFELTGRGNVDTWDWQLSYATMRNDQFVATSNVNLVENIGFGADATHTHGQSPRLQAPHQVPLPLPDVPVTWDRRADEWVTKNHFGGSLLTSVDRVRQYLWNPKRVNAPWR